jgi:hypothetical protein
VSAISSLSRSSMSDRNFLHPGCVLAAVWKQSANRCRRWSDTNRTPSIECPVPRGPVRQRTTSVMHFSDADPGLISGIKHQRQAPIHGRPCTMRDFQTEQLSQPSSSLTIPTEIPADTASSINGNVPSFPTIPWLVGSLLCNRCVRFSEQVQLVPIIQKRVQRSRRTEDSIEQRTRPSVLRPRVPGDR